MATQPKHYISLQEYLEQEETALDRHEYFDGEVFAMAGATPERGLISTNIVAEARPQLRKLGCLIRGSDMRIRTSPTGLYSYSDAVISSKPEMFDGSTLLNPIVIVEVLSESTQDCDRGGKFERYRQIPSFQEYLIVAQDRIYVEHHVRQGSVDQPAWRMRECTNIADTITLSTVNVSLPLASIYADVSLPVTSEAVPQPQLSPD